MKKIITFMLIVMMLVLSPMCLIAAPGPHSNHGWRGPEQHYHPAPPMRHPAPYYYNHYHYHHYCDEAFVIGGTMFLLGIMAGSNNF